jgi:hypothetical protein
MAGAALTTAGEIKPGWEGDVDKLCTLDDGARKATFPDRDDEMRLLQRNILLFERLMEPGAVVAMPEDADDDAAEEEDNGEESDDRGGGTGAAANFAKKLDRPEGTLDNSTCPGTRLLPGTETSFDLRVGDDERG